MQAVRPLSPWIYPAVMLISVKGLLLHNPTVVPLAVAKIRITYSSGASCSKLG